MHKAAGLHNHVQTQAVLLRAIGQCADIQMLQIEGITGIQRPGAGRQPLRVQQTGTKAGIGYAIRQRRAGDRLDPGGGIAHPPEARQVFDPAQDGDHNQHNHQQRYGKQHNASVLVVCLRA